ncbi:MAG: response regulator [Coraliomargarita sp.]
MQRHYLDAINPDEALSVANFFTFSGQDDWGSLYKALQERKTWSGRAVPLKSRHGITSVELMLHLDAAEPDRIWLYTLEHPEVGGEIRFSSRSEIQLLQVLLDNTLEYVFFRDLHGSFILTNKAFSDAVTSSPYDSPVGQTFDDYVSSESAEWVRAIDREVISSGKPSVNQVANFVFKNGTSHWLQMTTVPVQASNGDMVGYVSVARDISESKRTESELRSAIKEAKAASRAKGEFLAAMSHEIRTPINGIIGASELCNETELDVEQQGYVDTVIQCSNTLLSLVNDVLDFSKIEAGQLTLEQLNFNPESLLEGVIDEFTQAVRKKKIELILSCDEKLPRYLIGDPTRLKQIFYNLLGNAVKFTDEGEIVLRAELVRSGQQIATVRFSVKDTGIGISPERKEAIFSSFTQEDMSTTRKYGGTGLGLAISKELAELMAGTLEVQSELGQGSTFILEVPFDRSANPGIEAIPFSAELLDLRVLVVDDNETNREIYERMCSGWGYRSKGVKDGVAALKLLEQAQQTDDPFRLVLLDQQMPGINGLDLASLINSRPELKETKLLLLSSSLNSAEVERAESLGVHRALSKPVKRNTLLEVILEIFGVNGALQPDSLPNIVDDTTPTAPEKTQLEILLAEDNSVNQNIAKRRITKLGHKVTVVENGHEALEHIAQNSFDCILMDIQMPGMDGYETTQEIRKYEASEQLDRHFIVAMTAHAMKGDEEKCYESDMDEYISKPFRAERLQEVLEMAIRRKQSGASDMPSRVSQDSEQPQTFSVFYGSLDEESREDLLAAAEVMTKSVPRDICKLEHALREQNAASVKFMAHTLRGVAGIFSQQDLFALGERIESGCDDLAFDEIERMSKEFIVRLEVLVKEVEDVLSSSDS